MKLTTALALLPLVLAAPRNVTLQARELPNLTPVNIRNFDPDFDMKCEKVSIKGEQVSKAVSWGVNLQNANEVVGSRKYPHKYMNIEDFEFSEAICKNRNFRMEVPITKNGVFSGDDDDEAGKFRAIYAFDKDAKIETTDSNPTATYCGTIFHKGKGSRFTGCDVKPYPR